MKQPNIRNTAIFLAIVLFFASMCMLFVFAVGIAGAKGVVPPSPIYMCMLQERNFPEQNEAYPPEGYHCRISGEGSSISVDAVNEEVSEQEQTPVPVTEIVTEKPNLPVPTETEKSDLPIVTETPKPELPVESTPEKECKNPNQWKDGTVDCNAGGGNN
jgi:outer membrane biosynthesis protein TonB